MYTILIVFLSLANGHDTASSTTVGQFATLDACKAVVVKLREADAVHGAAWQSSQRVTCVYAGKQGTKS